MQEDAEAIEPFIENENGVLTFDEESAIDAGVEEVLVSETRKDINNANAVQDTMNRSNVVTPTCNGSNAGLVGAQFGHYVYMDSCEAEILSNLLYGGAGATTIAGAFTFVCLQLWLEVLLALAEQ
ncbi:hypothetical protein DH09_05255 [Bacillaceae bacterium JMAK1]|nr:hypothetical protein DH09_05255 [Bacillaceae bacterium JMAK1]